MKVVDRAVMPDGTDILLEDWHEHNTEEYPDLYGFSIGAYPMAQRTGKWRWVEGGRRFRLTISANQYMGYTDDQVKTDYEALKNGEKTLQDLAAHFWRGEKDMWLLGMDVEEPVFW